jgi:hypothetical protein
LRVRLSVSRPLIGAPSARWQRAVQPGAGSWQRVRTDRLPGLVGTGLRGSLGVIRGDAGREVQALYRYPVKPTSGEEIGAAVTAAGVQHDRRWVVYCDDGGMASGTRTRRFRPVFGLMRWASRMDDAELIPILISPQGVAYRADDPAVSEALSAAFFQGLTLRAPRHDPAPR